MPSLKKRIIAYCVLGTLAYGFYTWLTWWQPDFNIQSEHFYIDSTAEAAIAEAASIQLEHLYDFHQAFFQNSATEATHKYHVRIYKTREEMHDVNPIVPNWAEGFYMRKISHQYIDNYAGNPYDSLIHEGTHQLNKERCDYALPQWIEEGLACFFTVHFHPEPTPDQTFDLTRINRHSYPIRHIPVMPLSGDIIKDIAAGQLISVQDIVSGNKPLPMDSQFNTYYVHWYSLCSYLLLGKHPYSRQTVLEYIKSGAAESAFENTFGAYATVEAGWYAHLMQLQQSLKQNP